MMPRLHRRPLGVPGSPPLGAPSSQSYASSVESILLHLNALGDLRKWKPQVDDNDAIDAPVHSDDEIDPMLAIPRAPSPSEIDVDGEIERLQTEVDDLSLELNGAHARRIAHTMAHATKAHRLAMATSIQERESEDEATKLAIFGPHDNALYSEQTMLFNSIALSNSERADKALERALDDEQRLVYSRYATAVRGSAALLDMQESAAQEDANDAGRKGKLNDAALAVAMSHAEASADTLARCSSSEQLAWWRNEKKLSAVLLDELCDPDFKHSLREEELRRSIAPLHY